MTPATTPGDLEDEDDGKLFSLRPSVRRFWIVYDDAGYYASDMFTTHKAAKTCARILNENVAERRWKIAKYIRAGVTR